ncbi:acetylornithine transaminase [Micromonospora sp. CA-263727]|uniref:acetylornithine transaminase n=1 Tax=Micromonospora sp. CA-263727 TaxID=3239967 RepID=UPI003D8DDCF2
MANETERLLVRFDRAMMANYGPPSLALARGRGSRVWDVDGREYLDLFAGLAVSSLGHAHPTLIAAVSEQMARLAHVSNLYAHEPGVRLAERLVGLLETDGRVFFANSGAEANEAAVKLVRKAASGRKGYFVAAGGAFHGRTMGPLALSDPASIRDSFGPFGTEVRRVTFGDAEELTQVVTKDCLAVFLEPVQGEAGIVLPPPGYLATARALCDSTGAVLVFDEVQSGIGRTGSWFAHQHEAVLPDVLTLAKGLGGGLPIGACIGIGPFGAVFGHRDHGSTFGGNPVVCAAALAVLDVIEDEGLLANATRVGEQLASGAARLGNPVRGVRGRGLWQAILLTDPRAAAVEAAARRAGFLVNAVLPDVVRLAPPLILTPSEASSFLSVLPELLAANVR